MPVFRISLLHTHFIPDGLKGFVSGVRVVEQKHENLNFYYGDHLRHDISLLEFLIRYSNKEAKICAIEGDVDPQEIAWGMDRFIQYGLRYVLPWHCENDRYYNHGECTKGAIHMLRVMARRGVVLDCSHMTVPVLLESLKYYDGPVVFSHSVFRLMQNSRSKISNEITSGMVDAVSKRNFLIGIPLVNDLVSRHEPCNGKLMSEIGDVVAQIILAIKKVGVDRVCIGGDYFNFPYYSSRYGCSLAPVPGLDSKDGFEFLRKKLRDNGLSDNEIESVYFRNVERFNAEIEVDMKRKSFSSQYWSFSGGSDEGIIDVGHTLSCKTIDGHPTHAWIALNNYCNLACRHCRRTYSVVKPHENDISDLLYDRLFTEVLPGLKSLIIGGNNFAEVTRAKRFKHFVGELSLIKDRPRISVQTNGSAIPVDVMEDLIKMDVVLNISVEGGINETAKRIRGLGLDFLRTRLSAFNKLRRSHGESLSRVVLSFTAMKSTIHELPDLLEFAELNGVDEVNVLYMLPPTRDWNNECVYNDSVRVNDIVKRSRQIASGWHVELIAPEITHCSKDAACTRPWTSTSIDGYGDVRFCCLNESPIIGNLQSHHFDEIWNSLAAQNVREKVNSVPAAECERCVIRNLPLLSIRALEQHLK